MDRWELIDDYNGGWSLGSGIYSGQLGNNGYLGEYDDEGRIIGRVPIWFRKENEDEWYKIHYISFCGAMDLVIAPETSLQLASWAYRGCTNLKTGPKYIDTNFVYNTFYNCENLTGEIIFTDDGSYFTSMNCFYGAATAEGANLVVKAKTQDVLDELQKDLRGDEHITFELLSE